MDVRDIEKILEENLPPETFAEFQSYYKETSHYRSNEFDSLKSIRRFFMRKFESTNEVSFLETGLLLLEALHHQNAVDSNYILIHTAYFYEYLGQTEKADECIEKVLYPSTDRLFILEKIGKFYCHLAEKQFKIPVERLTRIFQTLTDKGDRYKETIEQQLKNVEIHQFYNRLKTLTGNDAEHFASKILNNTEILLRLRDLIDEMRQLVEAYKIAVDATYLDQVVMSSLKRVGMEFREKNNFELSNECSLLKIKCSEILTISKGPNDSNNFTNFHDMVDTLDVAKKQNLHLRDDAKTYYKDYKVYIEKSITLGEKAIKDIEPQHGNGPKFYSSLANVYRLRGNLKREKNKPTVEDYQRAVELFKALGDVIYTTKEYLNWDVERLAECYFFLGEHQFAIKQYEIIFEKSNTKKYQAALGLGDVYDAMGNFLSAKARYMECLEISQADPAVYDKLVHLHRNNGYYNEAIKWQQEMMKLVAVKSSQKLFDFGYFRLGILYKEKGDVERAIETFRYIVTERQPNSLISLDHFISILISEEEYHEAIRWLEKKIKISNSLVWDYCRLGDCYLAISDDYNAFEHYSKALAKNPTALSALQRIAKWYEQKMKYEEAIKLIKEIIDKVKKEQADGVYKWLGDIYLKLNDTTNAFDAYDTSLMIKPGQIEIFDRIKKITSQMPDQFLYQKISEMEDVYKESSSHEIATRIVNLSLNLKDKKYIAKAEEFLPLSIYQVGSFEYNDRLARIHENRGEYEGAIGEYLKIDKLEIDTTQKIRNLKTIATLITDKHLYHLQKTKTDCIRKIEDFILNVVPSVFESSIDDTNSINIEEIEENTYTFREDVLFLAQHYYANGYYSKAHQFIRRLTKSTRYEIQNDKVYLQKEANIFFSEGKLDDAEQVSYRIIRIKGEDSHALFLLGRISRCKKEFPKAIEYFKRSYKASGGRIDALDQIGATYRERAKEPTLTELEKTEIKQKAIECYESLRKQDRDDKVTLYGLAKSHLLEPLKNGDLQKGVEALLEILKSDIAQKTKYPQKTIDREAIKELLYLWAKYNENTVLEIISSTNKLTQSLDDYNRSFFIKTIIEIATNENIFVYKVVDAFKNLFIENSDKMIRRSVCHFLMKYVVWKVYEKISMQEIINILGEITALIINTASGGKLEAQSEAIEYLSEFLGSERGAYLEFLNEKTYHHVKGIEELILALHENNFSETEKELRKMIKSLKGNLKTINPLSSNEYQAKIHELLEIKQTQYISWAGNNIAVSINIGKTDDTCVLKSLWEKVDEFIYRSLEILKDSGLNGAFTLTLMTGLDAQSVSLLIAAELLDLQEDRHIIAERIKDLFNKIPNGDLKTFFSQFSTSFYALIIFKLQEEREKHLFSPFPRLLDFFESTYGLPLTTEYWYEAKEHTKDEINLDLPNIKDEIINHTLSQINKLTDRAKEKLHVFLNEAHDLTKLSCLSPDERRKRICRIKDVFRNIPYFIKGFLFPENEKETFSISECISSIKKDYNYPIKPNLHVNIRINVEEGIEDLFSGYKEHIKMIFRNFFHNAYEAINDRAEKMSDTSSENFNPEIQVTIYTKSNMYEILFSDNGKGISEGTKVKDLLTGSERKTGTGVGLTIISTLVNQYNGNFDIQSSKTGENPGTTFLIELPTFQK